jgi:hypothetical protein
MFSIPMDIPHGNFRELWSGYRPPHNIISLTALPAIRLRCNTLLVDDER